MEKETGTEVNETGLAKTNNYLAVALYKLLAKEEGNIFFSPFSISCAMAMLYQAARNQAAEELRPALGYEASGTSDNVIGSSFKALLKAVENGEGYVFNCANSVLLQKGFFVKESYLNTVREVFDALVLEVDFSKETSKVVSQINKWVSKKTNQLIPQLLKNLNPLTVVVLLNAVYFKGKWKDAFKEASTRDQLFYNTGLEESATVVPLMHMTKSFAFTTNESFSALQLPYIGENVAMLLMLPHARNGLKDLENQLSPSFVEEVRKSMRTRKVDVVLPRFRLEYEKSLKETFQALGVNDIFREGTDLGGMSDCKLLMVSKIIHKAVVVVNEEGTEAAAATVVTVKVRSIIRSEKFCADHPFFFVIYDTRSDLVLFMGKVEDLR